MGGSLSIERLAKTAEHLQVNIRVIHYIKVSMASILYSKWIMKELKYRY